MIQPITSPETHEIYMFADEGRTLGILSGPQRPGLETLWFAFCAEYGLPKSTKFDLRKVAAPRLLLDMEFGTVDDNCWPHLHFISWLIHKRGFTRLDEESLQPCAAVRN